eukprot:1188448-Rhodomonas_salina.2
MPEARVWMSGSQRIGRMRLLAPIVLLAAVVLSSARGQPPPADGMEQRILIGTVQRLSGSDPDLSTDLAAG